MLNFLYWRRKLIVVTVYTIVLFLFLLTAQYFYRLAKYYRSNPIEIHATLINSDFTRSAVQYHIISNAWDTEDIERYTTIWKTEEYGRLMSDEKRVWQYAQPESTLLIKMWFDEPYIYDIKIDNPDR